MTKTTTSGQSVPKSRFRKRSKQEQTAASKIRMEQRGEKLEAARDKLAKQKPPKKPGPGYRGSLPKPSEADSVGRGGATERGSFAAGGKASGSKSVPTKGVLQLLQYSGAVVLSQQPQGGRALRPAPVFLC